MRLFVTIFILLLNNCAPNVCYNADYYVQNMCVFDVNNTTNRKDIDLVINVVKTELHAHNPNIYDHDLVMRVHYSDTPTSITFTHEQESIACYDNNDSDILMRGCCSRYTYAEDLWYELEVYTDRPTYVLMLHTLAHEMIHRYHFQSNNYKSDETHPADLFCEPVEDCVETKAEKIISSFHRYKFDK